MRELMRVATVFEEWACLHVAFDHTEHTWSYFLEDNFGDACLKVLPVGGLEGFGSKECLRVALILGIPVWADCELPVPVDQMVRNPARRSFFKEFRIQTARRYHCLPTVENFKLGDDPFDEKFGIRFFRVHGIGDEGKLEHIADRDSYKMARDLVLKLALGAVCPERVVSVPFILSPATPPRKRNGV